MCIGIIGYFRDQTFALQWVKVNTVALKIFVLYFRGISLIFTPWPEYLHPCLEVPDYPIT